MTGRVLAFPSLFDLEPELAAPPPNFTRVRPGCDGGQPHDWVKTTTVWPGEQTERLTWTCRRAGCGELRGRA